MWFFFKTVRPSDRWAFSVAFTGCVCGGAVPCSVRIGERNCEIGDALRWGMPTVAWGASCRNGSDGIRSEGPHSRPHVALGPSIEKPPFPEVLERGKAPRHCPSAGVAMPGAGEVVEAGTQELGHPLASRSPPLLTTPPSLSLTVSHSAWGETTLNPQGVKRRVVRTRDETSKDPARSADPRSLTAAPFLLGPLPRPQDARCVHLLRAVGTELAVLHSAPVTEPFLEPSF